MDSYTPRLVLTGMLFLITLASGLWLSRLGKPYRPGIFNLHKLIALTTVILIGMIANGLRGVQEGPVLLELSLLSLAALLFLALSPVELCSALANPLHP